MIDARQTRNLLLLTILFGCLSLNNVYGQMVVADGTEVYFDDQTVTKTEAEKLGKALQELQFTDGTEKAVKLARKDGKLVFKMVLGDEHLKSGELDADLRLMCLQLSPYFGGEVVECHACDQNLKFKKKHEGLHGKRVEFGKAELYYNGVDENQFARVKKVMERLQFREFPGTIYFGKAKDQYEFRVACSEEVQKDEEIQRETTIWRDMFSEAIDKQKVAVMLCDEYIEPKFTRNAE